MYLTLWTNLFLDTLPSFVFMTWLVSGSPCLSNCCPLLASYRILFLSLSLKCWCSLLCQGTSFTVTASKRICCWLPNLHSRPHLCPEPQIQVSDRLLDMSIHVSSRPLTKHMCPTQSPSSPSRLTSSTFPILMNGTSTSMGAQASRSPPEFLLFPCSLVHPLTAEESLSWYFASWVFSPVCFSPSPTALPQFSPPTSFTWTA